MEAGNKKLAIQVVLFVVVFAMAFLGTKYVVSGFNSADGHLKKTAAEMNKECPKLIDAETRLDSTSAGDNIFEYHYSLVNFLKGDPNLDVARVKNGIRQSAQENFDANPELKEFREQKVSLKYSYKDKAGKDLFDFTIKSNNNK